MSRKSTANNAEDNDALSSLAAMGMGTLEDLASMVDGGDSAAIDEEEEEREFQQLMATRKAVPRADADALHEDDLIDELDDDEEEESDLPFVVKATSATRKQQQQQPAIAEAPLEIGPQFTIQPNHISAHRKNGTAVLRFTELFAPLSYKPVGVDPFVKSQTRGRPMLRRVGRFDGEEMVEEEEYDEETDEDRDTRFFEREDRKSVV